MIIFEIILGMIIALVFYNLIHHFCVIIPNRKKQLLVKHRTDFIVKKVLQIMRHDKLLVHSKVINRSSLLSQIWGRSIFAYDYTLNLQFSDYKQLLQFKKEFKNILTRYCIDHQLLTHKHNLFILADIWSYDKKTHLDLAYRINSSTLDYLQDLKKM